MIYLDYSATTPVRDEVLDSFVKVSKNYIGNPNSLHELGLDSKKLMDQATKQVAYLLGVKQDEVIFTSSASESNNLAIMGVLNYYKNRGKHIITTKLEHSSILETAEYCKKLGYVIDYVPLLDNGLIDMSAFEKLLCKDTILVSIAMVSSEVGILQDIKQIGTILENYPTTIFHVDGTQAIGKIPVSLDNIDLFTFSAHKFYGLKGIAGLIKKEGICLEPLIHGGKSQTIYRSGTPALALYVSLAKALRLALQDLDQKYQKVLSLNEFLVSKLTELDGVVINSNCYSIPHIVNISVPGIKPETILHALEQEKIYISTKTACSKDSSASLSLIAMNKDIDVASSSLRISLSSDTTMEEIELFLKKFEKIIASLRFCV